MPTATPPAAKSRSRLREATILLGLMSTALLVEKSFSYTGITLVLALAPSVLPLAVAIYLVRRDIRDDRNQGPKPYQGRN